MSNQPNVVTAIPQEVKDLLNQLLEATKSLNSDTPEPETTPDNTKETHIAMVLDSSGSMAICQQATIDGYNKQVEETRQIAADGRAGDVYLNLITFGEWDERQTRGIVSAKYVHEKIDKLEPISTETYRPQGSTPMNDGIFEAIRQLRIYDNGGDVAFRVDVFTDGQENASEMTGPELSKIITDLQAKGNWTFTVTGANIDLAELAKVTNIPLANMASYTATPQGTADAHLKYSSSSNSYLQARAAGARSVDNFYDPSAPQQPSTAFDQRFQKVSTQTIVPPFPNPTGAESKAWDHDKEEDDDNSLV